LLRGRQFLGSRKHIVINGKSRPHSGPSPDEHRASIIIHHRGW
jgi:hypothetical protein